MSCLSRFPGRISARVAAAILPMVGVLASASAQTTIITNTNASSMSLDGARIFYCNGTDEFCQFNHTMRSISVAGGATTVHMTEPGCSLDARYIKVDGAYGFTIGTTASTMSLVKFWSGGMNADPVVLTTVGTGGGTVLFGNIETLGDWVYWTTSTRIGRVRRDGTDAFQITTPEVIGRVIAVAPNGYAYWAEGGVGAGRIRRVDLGGSAVVETVAGSNFNRPRAIAADATHIYWTEDSAAIKRTTLAPGGTVTTLRSAITGGWSVGRFQIDGTRLFWNEFQSNGTGRLFRMPKGGGTPAQIGPGTLMFVSNLQQDTDQLYWMEGINPSIRRIRKDAAAVTPDFSWLGLEVTQGIQNINNNVPIVKGKPVLVRGYARSSTANYPNVRAQLAGVRTSTGAALAGSPLRSGVATNMVPTESAISDARRRNINSTFNWEVPESWLDGDVTLTATVNYDGAITENTTTNNAIVRAIDVSRIPPICIKARQTRTERPNFRTTSPGFREVIARFDSIFPASDVWIFPQSGQFEELSCCTWSPPFVYWGAWEVYEDSDKMIVQLIVEETFSSNPNQCNDADAETHRVAMVGPDVRTDGLGGYANYAWNVSFVKFSQGGSAAFERPDGGSTLAQEIAHNYNGVFGSRWLHVNCGNPDGINNAYPYPTSQIGPIGATNYYGYDFISRSIIPPNGAKDFMSYCGPAWTSDYSWRGLQNHLGLSPLASPPPPPGDYLFAVGFIDSSQNTAEVVQVFRIPNGTLEASRLSEFLTRQAANTSADPDFALELRNGSGGLVGTQLFDRLPQSHEHGQDLSIFTVITPDDPSVSSVTVKRINDGGIIGSRTGSASAPVISAITSPTAGQAITNNLQISWSASDLDGDILSYVVQYSNNNGASWQTLAANSPVTSFLVSDVDMLPGSPVPSAPNSCRIRIIASDGFRTAIRVSDAFSVSNRAPTATILSPADGAHFAAGETIVLRGSGYDPEEGQLSAPFNFTWQVTGQSIVSGPEVIYTDGFAPGTYNVQLVARDARQATGAYSITITVGDSIETPAGDIDSDGIADALDNCPMVANVDQADADQDGFGDVCDICAEAFNPDQGDHDVDGIGNPCDVEILYVNANATGQNTGLSWANAFNSLESALAATAGLPSVGEIWIAQGRYVPVSRATPSDPRSVRFVVRDGVAIRGGFAGDEHHAHDANPRANRTILSGDIAGNDSGNFGNRSENAYTVLVSGERLTQPPVLEGLVISGGNATGLSAAGGADLLGVSLTFRNCDFISNQGGARGGAASADAGNAVFDRCRFFGNTATSGAAVHINPVSIGGRVPGQPMFMNCLFTGNTATGGANGRGGAVTCIGVTPAFLNCTIAGNSSSGVGGGVYFEGVSPLAASVNNCIIYSNTDSSGGGTSAQIAVQGGIVANVGYSCIQGGFTGPNISVNPQFVDLNGPDNILGTVDDQARPLPGSPVNDAGSTPYSEPLATDLDGSPRRMDDRARSDTGVGPAPIVDMGAYEQTRCRADWNVNGALNSQDFFDFLTDFFELDPAADFNYNGFIDSQDLFDFLAQFFTGC